ncbi:hypothetical protein G7077_07290 [Sphingomonas piscis]|uniref:Uncharacterized protein n=1 Tax=Sphingomonas piscis TaxID=2714943 RepID=A0A6G7YPR9_9SPHN|nr:hypothetical protein [Sphingomonas piscis]QIK78727.1 hypothetical protein G7077_07290 [Sphingomonas piscis]
MLTEDGIYFDDVGDDAESLGQFLIEAAGKALLIIGFFGVKAALALGAINLASI